MLLKKPWQRIKTSQYNYRALGWFVLINTILASLIAIRFFTFFPAELATGSSILFIIAATIGHMGLLAVVAGLASSPALVLSQTSRRLIIALIGALSLSLLLIDTIVFAQYRFHINAVILELIMAGDVVSFPLKVWLMVIGGMAAILIFEFWLICFLEAKQQRIRPKLGRRLAYSIFAAFLVSNLIYAWSFANANQSISMVNRYLPLYYPLTANSMLRDLGWVDLAAIEQQNRLKKAGRGDLSYPLNPISGQAPQRPKDILLVVIDALRYDVLTQEIMPTAWKLSQKGLVYNNHISAGNCTRTGVFGLFYGIPGTYWHAVLANQRSSILIDRLQKLDYQLGIFTSAQLFNPEFDRTIFRNVQNLRLRSEGDMASDRDRDMMDDWKAWYQSSDASQPSFSFLFFDAPHGYDFPQDFEPKFEPMLSELNYLLLDEDTDPAPLFNRYKTSIKFVDSLIKEVIETLEARGSLDDTLIVITGDHGEEMNDNKLNFWGHNSNFTDYQVKVPFIMVGPQVLDKANTQFISSFTSHEDLVPTLMKNYLGVTNDIQDYSTGLDLYGNFTQRDWVISSSYSAYSIISADSILEVNTVGGYQLLDSANRIVDRPINSQHITQALDRISRFLK